MPVLHTTPDDFGLSCPEANRRKLELLVTAPYRVLHDDGAVLLGLAVSSGLGELFLCKMDEFALTYYLRFEVKQINQLGSTAARVALWRRCSPGLEGGTSRILHSLLNEYDAVVSDPSITIAGQRYWIDRMAEAHQKGLTVGVVDGDIPVPYKGRHLLDWIQTQDGGGREERYGGKPFFVAKKLVG